MSTNKIFNYVEQILNRPINSFDASQVDNWVSKYGFDYLNIILPSLVSDVKNMRVRVYSTNYIDTFLFKNYELYSNILKTLGNTNHTTQEIKEEPIKEEKQQIELNDWDEYPELEREYWVAKLGYTFYPNEYPNPDLNSKYDGINKN